MTTWLVGWLVGRSVGRLVVVLWWTSGPLTFRTRFDGGDEKLRQDGNLPFKKTAAKKGCYYKKNAQLPPRYYANL